MIIRPHDSSWLLITQPDHAALAARVMREWQDAALQSSPRRAEILLAVAEHDNGWQEADDAPAIDPASGQLLDFIAVPAETRQGVWPRAVERLSATPYAAALVAQHAVHVYSRFRGDEEWRAFFTNMEAMRDRQLAAEGSASRDELLADYQFVRIGDLVSLTFCNAWTTPQADGFGRTVQFDGSRVTVSPDPFGGRTVAFEITGREIESLDFGSAAEARRVIGGAPARTIAGTVAGR